MKINTDEQQGKEGVNNLILLTRPRTKTEQEVYRENQRELLRGIFERWNHKK